MWFQGRDLDRCVAALSLQQKQRSDINMISSNWRDGKIRKLWTIMGEKVMQSYLTNTLKAGVIYEKDAEDLSLRGFCHDKQHVASKIKNMLEFLHL